MTKIPYEIPAEIRDLTAKSVEDARKAFESFIEANRLDPRRQCFHLFRPLAHALAPLWPTKFQKDTRSVQAN